MPISTDKLERKWIEFDVTATVQDLRDRINASGDKWTYLVVKQDPDHFAVLRLNELIQYLEPGNHMATPALLNKSLASFPDLLEKFASASAQQAQTSLTAAQNLARKQPSKRLVILNGSELVGLITAESRGGLSQVDLDWLDKVAVPANGGGGHISHAKPPMKNGGEQPESAPPPPSPGVLTTEPPTAAPAPPTRFINAAFEDHDTNVPLQIGNTYTLAFDVDEKMRAEAISAAPIDERRFFQPGEEQVNITVQLVGDDFNVLTGPQNLIVPRTGKSKNKARFDLEPKHNGESVLTALFMKEGNLVQAMVLKLNVGLPGQPSVLGVQTLGRGVDQGFAAQPRDLTMWIDFTGANFKVNLAGAMAATATLPLTLPELEQIIGDARTALQSIVELQDGGALVYQSGTQIPAAVNQKALGILALAGWNLYRSIFLHPGADAQTKLVAGKLREMAQKQTLKIQIASQQLMLPWGMMYVADTFDQNALDPNLFLGFKHIIEHIPFQPNMDVLDGTINSQPHLTVSLNLNPDIDQQMGAPLIANQRKYWAALNGKSGLDVVERLDQDSVVKAFSNPATPDQIVYLYCHAVSKTLAEGGPNASALQFGKNSLLTLKDLNQLAPTDTHLPGNPLIFINACESAELSPMFYNGFMPYFVEKGARGLIGTECPVPAVLAVEWAKKFFDGFLAGKPLGDLFLSLRKDFYFNNNNVLGLLYALYCDSDTVIAPALAVN